MHLISDLAYIAETTVAKGRTPILFVTQFGCSKLTEILFVTQFG